MRTQFPEVLDSTMRGSWKACPRKFFWNYVFEIAPDGENVHLHAGGCFAKGLEASRLAFYGEGKPYEDSVLDGAEAFLRQWGSFDPGEGETKTVDRVLGAYCTACGECFFCRRGDFHKCDDGRVFGHGKTLGSLQGSQAEQVVEADGPSATEEGVPDEIKDALFNPYAKHGQG